MKEKRGSTVYHAALAKAIAMGLIFGYELALPPTLANGVHRKPELWDRIQLSKAERRGKGPEEIQALRKAKWEAMRGGKA